MRVLLDLLNDNFYGSRESGRIGMKAIIKTEVRASQEFSLESAGL